jgi:pimeloyl-ACP methyl ester carboxylesterase
MRLRIVAAYLVGLLALFLVAPASAADKIAIVMLHGGGSSGSQFDDVRPIIAKAGYRIVTPDMCWAQSRQYDTTAEGCLADVDKQVDRLKAEGYTRIVIAGHSRGGIFAIYYAANRKGLAGVIAMAPSGPPTGMDSNSLAVKLAHDMIKQGRGEQVINWSSGINELWATPNAYLSWSGMESPLYDKELLPRLTAPLLWVAGTQDPGQRAAGERFAYAPANPLNALISVEADHFATPDVAVYDLLKWLDRLSDVKATN